MSVEERCVHQGIDTGAHVLFKEKWERCKNCAYDPENNKRCTDYTKVEYYISDEKPKFESNLNVVYSVVRSDLEKEAIA
jgi:hypothetical protein